MIVEDKEAFGAALRLARESLGWSREELGAKIGEQMGRDPYSGQSVLWWETPQEGRNSPPPAAVFAVEQVLGMKPGMLSRHLGFMPADTGRLRGLFDAVDYEPKLTPQEKDAVKALLRTLMRDR